MQRRDLSTLKQAVVFLAAIALAACGGSSTPKPVVINTGTTFSIPNYTYGLPEGIVNQPYAYGFQTNVGQAGINGKAPITFSATGLPPGMSLNSSGVLNGTPTTPGYFLMTVYAVDSSASPLATSKEFPVDIIQPRATLTQFGHSDLGGTGQNGSVTVAVASASQTPYAYVGTRGAPGDCPASGIKIVDLSSLSNPQLVAHAGAVTGAAQARAYVLTGVNTPDFHSGRTGDLLAVTEQPCDPANATSNQEGVEFFDVTDPSHPVPLGTWSSGVDGAGDVVLLASGGHLYALVAVPNSETGPLDSSEGDLRVLDVTDPSAPREIGNWGLAHATGVPLSNMTMGQDQRVFLDTIHLSSDGKTAYLAYWDGGVVVLDVSNPTDIASNNGGIFLNHLVYPITAAATSTTPSAPEGNTHAALPVDNGAGMMVSDFVCASGTPLNPALAVVCGSKNSTTLSTNAGWGYLRTYTLTSPSAASLAGFYVTPGSVSAPAPDDGIYSAYDIAWNGDNNHPRGYVAWYSSGLVELDLSNPASPTLLATFVPPATPDPNGRTAQDNPPTPLVDGVASFQSGGQQYVLASDMNSGLWILKDTPSPGLSIVTQSLPQGNVNVPYEATIAAVNPLLGAGSLVFSLAPSSNPLPPGMVLDTHGNLSGTPLVTGSTVLTFLATDGSGQTAEQTLTLNIGQSLAIIPEPPPMATFQEPYSLTLFAANGTQPYTWSLVGNVPSGMTIDASSGVLSGTPQTLGATTLTVQVTDSSTPAVSATLPLTIDVERLKVATASLTDGSVGVAYADTVTMNNGTGPYTPTVIDGTLPPGLSVSVGGDPTAGWLISGTPTTAGTYSFTVLITDDDGQTISQPFTLIVNPFEINPSVLPAAEEGHGYSQGLSVQGGASPYLFSLVTGSLPAGLTLSSGGVINGVPASGSAGTYSPQVQIRDSNGIVAQQTLQLVVFSGNSFAVTTTGLPPAEVGQSFTQTIAADFGVPPYSFSLASGVLPAGTSFTPDGTISGVPAGGAAGSYSFTIQATDSDGNTASQHFTWTILPAGSPQ